MSLLKCIALAIFVLPVPPARGDDSYPARTDVLAAYEAYSSGLNSGNAGIAAAAFAEKTYMVAGTICTVQVPCRTRGAVKTNIEGWIASGLRDRPVAEPQVLGNMLVARVEVVWDGIKDMGIERILGTDFVEAEGGLIVRKVFIADSNDEQTRKFLRTFANGN